MPRQLNALQAGRAFAAVSVVLFHANDVLRLPKYLGQEVEPVFRAGSSGVAFFFVLSGFVIFLAHRKDLGRSTQLSSFAGKRFKRVYLPLLCVLAIVVPIYYIVPSLGRGGERSFVNLILAITILPAPYERLLTPEWTLRHEILFYAFFATAILSRRIGFVVLSAWFVLSAILPWTHPDFPMGFFFSANHLAFALGMLAFAVYDRYEWKTQLAGFVAAAGIVCFALAWIERCRKPDFWFHQVDLLFALGTALFIVGSVNLERLGKVKVWRPFIFIGEASYSIYLVHHPALSLFTKLLLHAQHRLFDKEIFCAIVLLSITCGIIFHVVVEKPLLAFANRGKAKPVHG